MNSCQRCGTCCKNGGPALHKQDLGLFNDNTLRIDDCLTIRKDEPVNNPLSQAIEPVKRELIKISGCSDSWQCRFFDATKNQCGIYSNRPVECHALQCWNTGPLLDLIYVDNLTRADLITDQALLEVISKHEKLCAYDRFNKFALDANRQELSTMINLDLSIRLKAVQQFNLSIDQEMFCFGRPIFKSADFYGLILHSTRMGFEVVS